MQAEVEGLQQEKTATLMEKTSDQELMDQIEAQMDASQSTITHLKTEKEHLTVIGLRECASSEVLQHIQLMSVALDLTRLFV